MSCTVVALPFALAPIVLTAISTAATAAVAANSAVGGLNGIDFENIDFLSEDEILAQQNSCEDMNVLSMNNIIDKSFETQFMDKDILLKTLDEHGAKYIEEDFDGAVKCKVDNYALKFYKESSDKPYSLIISATEDSNVEEKVDDIKSEYTANVQEAAYLNIIEKLKENNMQLEDETVEDDNTIVLTINLE